MENKEIKDFYKLSWQFKFRRYLSLKENEETLYQLLKETQVKFGRAPLKELIEMYENDKRNGLGKLCTQEMRKELVKAYKFWWKYNRYRLFRIPTYLHPDKSSVYPRYYLA